MAIAALLLHCLGTCRMLLAHCPCTNMIWWHCDGFATDALDLCSSRCTVVTLLVYFQGMSCCTDFAPAWCGSHEDGNSIPYAPIHKFKTTRPSEGLSLLVVLARGVEGFACFSGNSQPSNQNHSTLLILYVWTMVKHVLSKGRSTVFAESSDGLFLHSVLSLLFHTVIMLPATDILTK